MVASIADEIFSLVMRKAEHFSDLSTPGSVYNRATCVSAYGRNEIISFCRDIANCPITCVFSRIVTL